MNKKYILVIPVIFLFLIGCENKKKSKDDMTKDSTTSDISSKQQDSATVKLTDNKVDSPIVKNDTPSFLHGPNVKTDDFIIQYPKNEKNVLRNQIEGLRKEWKNVPNPFIATYKGNDFGDYHHIMFEDAKGRAYDFGQAENNYGSYKLFETKGQYEDNPKLLGKKFNVYWDWKLSEFPCCEGEYDKAKAYLPAITKLELIKK